MKSLAVSYVRVSSKDQDVDRQKDELKSFSQKKDLQIVKFFEDKISATKSNINERTGFKKLKKFLLDDNNNVKNLLVHEVSRLGRKNHEVQSIIEDFSQLGVNIHFMDLNLSTLDENGLKSPESSIIISILGSMAENENRLLSKRIKGGLLASAKKGLAFSDKITGYKKGKDGRPIIDENQAPIVRRMYEMASKNTTLYFISKKIKEEFGTNINSKTISGIIKNPFYKGERMYLGEIIKVDAIVSKEKWELANKFLNSRKVFTKRHRVYENILEGKIECYNCSKPLYQYIVPKSRSNLYKCSQKCSGISVNRPWLFQMIRYVVEKHTEKVNDKKFKEDLQNKIAENLKYIEDLKIQQSTTESAQLQNYDRFLKGKVKEVIYEKTNDNYEKQLKTIELKLNNCLEKNNSFKKALKSKPKHFSNDLKTFKVQIQDILECVEVDENFVIINIQDVVKYKIPKINGTELGWIKRKNKGKDVKFDSPFKTGIITKRCFSDTDLEALIYEHQNPRYNLEVEDYFNSKEYKDKIKGIGSLGTNMS
ncbi:recombinase family protein [Tenacibaculum sp. IMCC1]|nr:hypothetical protein KUL118_15580 [Tenacibaculum sp. KUL118]